MLINLSTRELESYSINKKIVSPNKIEKKVKSDDCGENQKKS